MQSHPYIQQRIVRIELAYYRDNHKSEVIYKAELFKINKVTGKKRLTNLCVLLQGFSDHGDGTQPTNTDTYTALQGNITDTPSEDEVVVNELYVTLWMEQNAPTWYLGHCILRNPDVQLSVKKSKCT